MTSETAGKIAVCERAEKEGLQFIDKGDKGLLSYEEPSEQNGVPLLIKIGTSAARTPSSSFQRPSSKPRKTPKRSTPSLTDSPYFGLVEDHEDVRLDRHRRPRSTDRHNHDGANSAKSFPSAPRTIVGAKTVFNWPASWVSSMAAAAI